MKQRLVASVRDRYRGEFAGAQAAREHQGIAPVGLDALTVASMVPIR